MKTKPGLAFLGALLCASLAGGAVANAKVKSQLVEYKQGDQALEGYLAWDDAAKGKHPGVLIVHDWMGLGEDSKKRADMLAGMGYVAFAADIYGKGNLPKDAKEAGALAGKFKADRNLLRARANAALDQLVANPHVDATKIAAIGYCFGGTTVLELGRSGAPVAGVVTFHGGLDSPTPADGKNFKGKVLVLHGASDPYEKPEDFAAFQKELNDAKVDWELTMYGGAVHCFTIKADGDDASKGCAYNAEADARSWVAMQTFFGEIFGTAKK